MKRLFAFLLALTMLLSLAACGGGEEDPNAGKYIGVTAAVGGFSMPMSDIYEGETWIELKSGGKGTIMLDGDEFKIKWSLEGNAFTLTVQGVDSVGTLSSGDIVIDLMDMGCVMTFEKEGGSIADKVANMATYNDTGYWELIRIDGATEEDSVGEEDLKLLKRMGMTMYLELLEDGTGVLFMDEELPVIWQDGKVNYEAEDLILSYTLEGDVMTLDMVESKLVFRKGFKPLPSEMAAAGFTEFMDVGVIYPFEMMCIKDNTRTTMGEVIVTDYQIFDSAEGYEYKEGYEWRVATIQIRVYDDNAYYFNASASIRFEDYYTTTLHDDSGSGWQETSEDSDYFFDTYTLIHQGQEMEAYERYVDSGWSKWSWAEGEKRGNIRTFTAEYHVPVGYDGVVVGFYDSCAEPDGARYILEIDPKVCMLFRMY